MTRSVDKAHGRITAAITRAEANIGKIPLGHRPRGRQAAETDARIRMEMEKFLRDKLNSRPQGLYPSQDNALNRPSYPGGGYMGTKQRMIEKLPKAQQSEKNQAAGKPVDPTSFEMAQSAEPATPDMGSMLGDDY
jgi:hypothetical protein